MIRKLHWVAFCVVWVVYLASAFPLFILCVAGDFSYDHIIPRLKKMAESFMPKPQ